MSKSDYFMEGAPYYGDQKAERAYDVLSDAMMSFISNYAVNPITSAPISVNLTEINPAWVMFRRIEGQTLANALPTNFKRDSRVGIEFFDPEKISLSEGQIGLFVFPNLYMLKSGSLLTSLLASSRIVRDLYEDYGYIDPDSLVENNIITREQIVPDEWTYRYLVAQMMLIQDGSYYQLFLDRISKEDFPRASFERIPAMLGRLNRLWHRGRYYYDDMFVARSFNEESLDIFRDLSTHYAALYILESGSVSKNKSTAKNLKTQFDPI